jgi:hypothetical protein
MLLFRVCFAGLSNGSEVFWGRATFEGGGGVSVTAEILDGKESSTVVMLCKPISIRYRGEDEQGKK